ncbi:hypothetical protein [Flectobacillus roseus]|uniref:DoxX family membrane protein n=1 Tax=Flectobacillus roseus TaxID=502259 RepID=A0ABT6Y567_9BACT|nr:hypothetical protein [Flectobacillus roseus]MDI9858268.1 hypothetical protein [Flectobacillus roseus]MDI9867805.1 hypothetical protein [Flectobacillus roseus]
MLSIISGLVVAKVLSRIGLAFLKAVPTSIIISISVVFLFSYVVYFLRRAKKETNFDKIYKLQLALLCGAVAFDLITFGWQKIYHLQFIVPLGMLDLPFTEIDDVSLMWAFFGHSYPFTVTIGLTQMLGSLLLLFSRTRLLGVFILLPILVTILFIDIFYHLDIGVILHALMLIMALVYLIFQNIEFVQAFFLNQKLNTSDLLDQSSFKKTITRVLILFLPLVLILLRLPIDKNPQLTGKYHVQTIKINHVNTTAKSPYDSTLTRVYFDIGNDIVFDFNTTERRYIGTYQLKNNQIVAKWHFPRKDLPIFSGKISLANNQILLVGKMGKDSVEIYLKPFKR